MQIKFFADTCVLAEGFPGHHFRQSVRGLSRRRSWGLRLPFQYSNSHDSWSKKILHRKGNKCIKTVSTTEWIKWGINRVIREVVPENNLYDTNQVIWEVNFQRGCIFPDEIDTIFGGYSNSDCIMDCKIKSIGVLCRCTPFNYINVFKSKAFPQCTLADLRCLNSYSGKQTGWYARLWRQDILQLNICQNFKLSGGRWTPRDSRIVPGWLRNDRTPWGVPTAFLLVRTRGIL